MDASAEKARLLKEQADHAALKNAQLRAELLPAAEVVEGWQAAIGRARALLLGIPTACADELAVRAASGPGAVRDYLRDRIDAALSELTNTALDEADAQPSD